MIDRPPKSKYAKDFMIRKLRWKYDTMGRTPTMAEIDAEPNMPHADLYVKVFGTYRKALEAAGLK